MAILLIIGTVISYYALLILVKYITFGVIPNVSNYGHFFMKFVCLLLYPRGEWVDFIHIWCNNKAPCVTDSYKIAISSMPNLSNYGNIVHNIYMFVVISWRRKG